MSLKHAILGLLSYEPMSGYDLNRIFKESINYFWNASVSQIYRDLSSLEEMGCVTFQIEPQEGRPDKKIYSVTEKGKSELEDWLKRFPDQLKTAYRDEFLVRVFFGARISPEELKYELRKLTRELQQGIEQLKSGREQIEGHERYPDEDKFFWELTARLGYKSLVVFKEWAEESIQSIDEYYQKKSATNLKK
ncbi:MAG TPA: PadR family transcriptional regulator [Bacillota bacterium]|nr:PadR family transcriptional regulator [Bacillota bacterium]